MKTIHDLTKRVEEAHIRHLKEVKSLEEQTRNVSSTSSPLPANVPSTNDTNVSFESLVGGKNTQVKSGDDMFGSFSSNQATPQPWSSSSTNQAIQPTPSSSNGWIAPQPATSTNNWNAPKPITPQQQPSNNWNSPKPATPQQQPSNNWNTPMSPSMNTHKPMNATNTWNSPLQAKQTTGWSTSVQSQQIPSLSTPPSFQSNLYNQNSSMNGSNFNALRSIPVTQKQPTMMPLSSGMGLLQPIQSSPNTNINNNVSQAKKMANLHAFDPLG